MPGQSKGHKVSGSLRLWEIGTELHKGGDFERKHACSNQPAAGRLWESAAQSDAELRMLSRSQTGALLRHISGLSASS